MDTVCCWRVLSGFDIGIGILLLLLLVMAVMEVMNNISLPADRRAFIYLSSCSRYLPTIFIMAVNDGRHKGIDCLLS